jgi:carbon monoxide dehydrogenase subunit G
MTAAAAGPAAAETALTPYSADYKVKISVLSGRLTTELRRLEDGYEANHVIEPQGLASMMKDGKISEQSRFTARADGVRASWYRSEDSLSSDETSAEVTFDWSASELSGTVNEEKVEIMLDDVVHDRVAIQYQLMHDLLNGEPNERYVLFDIDEFKTLTVRKIGIRRISTPAGKFTAVGIQHQAENSSRVTTFWCVEELGFLPVVIEQHRNGKLRMRAELERYAALAS